MWQILRLLNLIQHSSLLFLIPKGELSEMIKSKFWKEKKKLKEGKLLFEATKRTWSQIQKLKAYFLIWMKSTSERQIQLSFCFG